MKSATASTLLFLVFLFTIRFMFHVSAAESAAAVDNVNPVDYWKEHTIQNSLSAMPEFLLNKASPLTPAKISAFSKLVGDHKWLCTHLPEFCEQANLFCSNSSHNTQNLGSAQEQQTYYINYSKAGPDLKNYVSDFESYMEERVSSSDQNQNVDDDDTFAPVKGRKVRQTVLDPGSFFREEMLRTGNVMPLPDFRDKMPKRSFLPRVIVSKLPFSTSKLEDMKAVFHATDGSAIEKMFTNALSECERAPNPGETKHCVASIEDMIDFSTSLLGRNVTVRSMESDRGFNTKIMIGEVKGIRGGNVTESVSCHQTLLPYMLYYCHSVPKVRVYEADILDSESKTKINHGVAICHLDTSTWSPDHEAFVSLGSGPGKIEVCHWIFEGDMTWTIEG